MKKHSNKIVITEPDFKTRVYYKGKEVDMNDIQVSWCDCMGERKQGTVKDYGRSEASDAVAECEAGEGW